VFSNENSGIIGGISLLITIVGLIATLWGLRVTYLQLIRTRTVAEEVKAKAESIKTQVELFDVSVDMVKAIKSFDQFLAVRKLGGSQNLLPPLEDAQSKIHRISMHLSEDRDFSSSIKDDAAFFAREIQTIEQCIEKDLDYESAELVARCRGTKLSLEGKLIEFQKGLYNA
jgi:CHASE3 domain sensor protein